MPMINTNTGPKWYAAGLDFECRECGRCCSGPGEGYIWAVQPELEWIAQYLGITMDELRQRYLRRVGARTSIVEDALTKDCIFLRKSDGKKQCAIYPVRPSQCRTWPFWPENLASFHAWNVTAGHCPGMNRGRHYSASQIEQIRKNERWWEQTQDDVKSSKR
jgi:Fe-S-cluster containining protein